jgi:hypothetical protein
MSGASLLLPQYTYMSFMGRNLSCMHIVHDVLISGYMYLISVVYEGDMDNDEEAEVLKVKDGSETDIKEDYKELRQSKVSDGIQTQGIISGENSSGSEVSEEVEDSQRRPTAFEIASGTASSHNSRNQQGSYTPLNILLIPRTNTSMDISGIDSKFPEGVTNENRDTKKSTVNIKL